MKEAMAVVAKRVIVKRNAFPTSSVGIITVLAVVTNA
jgi:hypothetical protein